ncbi:SDR family NAD(P)-dependent oxidoreductase [Psychrosphaera sp. B3R10]|uniref:SDR family NAD(P)-dependent oxidoreductase n=1 Tax=unclassified Psychrosphaera TaxID=2641570 RepID=UPI001C0A5C91|nr:MULTISPECIES: SDR family NAD(P)-dependent oxidoreductase [unclassified Psychrosphaera]MBU2882439.1 SDR family NAD(P)-dependent oxidoreductase [Psychrosphaera sp. I2R16]MBU2990260.1 SDR family NAD(P)-dependent oxidoreductase [Psychrosphaera sp. B3R10]
MSEAKFALVTGATSGIGAEIAKNLANSYQVYGCGRNVDRLNTLTKSSKNIYPLQFDVTNKPEIEEASKAIFDLDLIVLNAGDCEYIDDTINFDDKLFERIIKTNLISIGYCLNLWLPRLKPGGHIVFIGSSVTYFPFAKAEAYGASKAGINYLANSMRQSLAPKGYTVTLVEPGFVKTPLTDKNTFDMPFLMTAKEASDAIVKGISKKKNRIRFPLMLILTLKFLSLLPVKWQTLLTVKDV